MIIVQHWRWKGDNVSTMGVADATKISPWTELTLKRIKETIIIHLQLITFRVNQIQNGRHSQIILKPVESQHWSLK